MFVFRQFCEIHSINNIIFADRDAETEVKKAVFHKHLNTLNIVFTSELDVEKDILKEQFEVCKDMYISSCGENERHISAIQSSPDLKEKVENFLVSKKSEYPHLINMSSRFKIRSFDSVLSLLGRK